MESGNGSSRSLWMDDAEISARGPLEDSPKCDVCVIGAGIAGITTAYLLAQAGKSVIVLERGSFLDGETPRTTAHLSPIMDDGLARMERLHGLENSRLIWQSHSSAVDWIEETVRREKIECEFRRVDGFLAGAPESDFEAALRAGIPVQKVHRAPIADFDSGPAFRFPDQGRIHATKYLAGLRRVFSALGGKIVPQTPATEIEWTPTPTVKVASGHRVIADSVVEATNSPISGSVRTITQLFPYRTYAIALQIPRGTAPFLYWDDEDPYHYVRSQPGREFSEQDLLIVGGEDHKTGQADDAVERYRRLEAWVRKRWPMAGEVTHRWSGQVLETPDGLAFIGRNPGNPANAYLIAGDSGHGMTHGTLGARLVADLILGKSNPYTHLYSPKRLPRKGIGLWAKENANVGRQYLDWLPFVKTSDVKDIREGEGAVVQSGLGKLAIYKDPSGKLQACSAVCPHLGGIVQWNSGEKTWDCPCHGSRFDRYGDAICAPAASALPPNLARLGTIIEKTE